MRHETLQDHSAFGNTHLPGSWVLICPPHPVGTTREQRRACSAPLVLSSLAHSRWESIKKSLGPPDADNELKMD